MTKIEELERNALGCRRALAEFERAYSRWRRLKKTAKLGAVARGAALDAWIKDLGEARWRLARAVADLSEARRK